MKIIRLHKKNMWLDKKQFISHKILPPSTETGCHDELQVLGDFLVELSNVLVAKVIPEDVFAFKKDELLDVLALTGVLAYDVSGKDCFLGLVKFDPEWPLYLTFWLCLTSCNYMKQVEFTISRQIINCNFKIKDEMW